ncbi:MAG TPA: 4-alpha-glucanotransferase [Terriglobales bacterium]|nr:4-alpha-glucanotransferase [Terriglobales bacterium]
MSEKHLLQSLARLYNVQADYYDIFGHHIEPPADALLRVLRILGAPAERMSDLPEALRQRRQSLWQRGIDPVIVTWDQKPLSLKLRLPRPLSEAPAKYQVTLESGDTLAGRCQEDAKIKPSARRIEGVDYITRQVTVNERLPLGYHHLSLQLKDLLLEAYLFSAPLDNPGVRAAPQHQWGIFCPLYALRSGKSWSAGDFSDLASLVDFTDRMGGDIVGTLPLLSAFLDEPFNPSPYSPVSRLFWNEFYLDVARIPELQGCPAAREKMQSAVFQAEMASLKEASLVDYPRIMALKRAILEELARSLRSAPAARRTSFEQFVASHPRAEDYASFRAMVEQERKPWTQWPLPSRDGLLRSSDYSEAAKHFHLYVQWQADEQMRALWEKTQAGGPALYLDFPLGVNRDGYDVWRERAVFALEASGGAPPDGFFTKGHDWGFPPLHPEGLRRQGYRYYIHCLRHHLQYAGMLRIDHVMGLHRFYWVPQGFAPHEGVYVRYPAEEFYAVLNLECHRHHARVVGENLGTVPPAVNQALARHKILRMYVSQFSVTQDSGRALEEAPPECVASLNTHDTPTFAGFWNEEDIQDRLKLGLLNGHEVTEETEHRGRQRAALVAYLKSCGLLAEGVSDPLAVLRAWLCYLARGPVHVLLVNLEDLWLEPLPQNVPGTWQERPNWQRKARFPLETLRTMSSVVDTLKMIHATRKEGR